MKTRRRAAAAADKVVPTAVAKRDWFLKASDLATLQGPSNLKETVKESPFCAAGDFLYSN
jgi:hypothetical protein